MTYPVHICFDISYKIVQLRICNSLQARVESQYNTVGEILEETKPIGILLYSKRNSLEL